METQQLARKKPHHVRSNEVFVMQELQEQTGALGEKRSNRAIWQPAAEVTPAVHALTESR